MHRIELEPLPPRCLVKPSLGQRSAAIYRFQEKIGTFIGKSLRLLTNFFEALSIDELLGNLGCSAPLGKVTNGGSSSSIVIRSCLV